MKDKLFLIQQMNATLLATSEKIQTKANQLSETMTTRQFMMLLAISHLEKGASYNSIAHKLGTTKQNAKQIVTALEKRKLVTVTGSTEDRRAVHVEITPKGIAAEHEWGKIGNDFLMQMGESFSVEELELLWRLLKKLYAFDGEAFNGFENE